MIIKITNYPVGVHELFFEKKTYELQLGEPFIDNVKLICMMDKSTHQIILNCNLTIIAELVCDRCNEKFKTELNSKFSLVYLFDKKEAAEDLNVFYISPNDDKIDITNDVIDYANLSIPMKKLCSETCKGLSTNCGTNLNIGNCNCEQNELDPTWEPLLKLKNKLN
jgi:uncharacterized protein